MSNARFWFDAYKAKKDLAKLNKHFGQSKKHSLFESITNVIVGFGISTVANMIVLPWFGQHPSWGDAAGIGGVLTVVSIIRSYLLRRIYNQIYLKGLIQ